MKKILISAVAIAMAGCGGYDYYQGNIRYVQDGENCIYYANEEGREYSGGIKDVDLGKRVVYRNTRCSDLFLRDNDGVLPRPERQVLNYATPECGCAKSTSCGATTTRRYVFVPVK